MNLCVSLQKFEILCSAARAEIKLQFQSGKDRAHSFWFKTPLLKLDLGRYFLFVMIIK